MQQFAPFSMDSFAGGIIIPLMSAMIKLLAAILLITGLRALSQNPSYTQYTVKDGLAGSIVYQALQDNNGYIWFATNQGVSRFDGKVFRNFTKADGLPDNEILKMYLDKFNNIWFISLSGIASVLDHKGIHIIRNCKAVFSVAEDVPTNSIYLLTEFFKSNKRVMGCYPSPDNPGHWRFSDTVHVLPEDNHYLPMIRIASHKGIVFYNNAIYLVDSTRFLRIISLKDLHLADFNINGMLHDNDTILWICTRNQGLLKVNNIFSRHKTVQSFFPEAFCTSILKDREGSYWVTTHGDGVYYLPNLDSYYIQESSRLAGKDVKCLQPVHSHTLAAGFANGDVMLIDQDSLKAIPFTRWKNANKNNRILDIKPFDADHLLVGTDLGLHLLSYAGAFRRVGYALSIKNIFLSKDRTIMVACAEGLCILETRSGQITTVYRSRTTCVNGIGMDYYFGTLRGMYVYSHRNLQYLGDVYPALSGVITHIDMGNDSSIWVSTPQGLAVLKNRHIQVLGMAQGLLSDLCKGVSIEANTAWVSTDKGVSRLAFRWEGKTLIYSISNITENDGLISNDVSQTALSGDYVWAATSRGVSFFPKVFMPHSMQSPLINISITSGVKDEMINPDSAVVHYKNNKLSLGLSAISFRSGGEVGYRYRLKDLDTAWMSTKNNFLEFSLLPFGNHLFEVQAVDRWGVASSQTKRMVIVVSPPFWKTDWFLLITYFLIASVIGFIMYIALRMRQRKKEEKFHLQKKIGELEMMALRAQMNPHFIFNCLSSIQHYILRADVRNANLYLYKFSTLIRKILQANSFITLSEELSILELYMELEKLRLGDRMDYRIHVSDTLNPSALLIPSLILHPFVENAVKHGIPPLKEEKGIIHIDFQLSGNYLVCTIEDNGAGIHSSGVKQEAHLPGYRSLGSDITRTRINIINTLQKGKMQLKVMDKRQAGLDINGTVVQVYFLL